MSTLSAETRAIAEAADANLVLHASWLARQLPGMRVMEDPGLVLVDSGLACDTYNFVLRSRLRPGNARRRADEAIAYFRTARRPFSWWVGPIDEPADLGSLLEAAGLCPSEDELAMFADLDSLSGAAPAPPELCIERVRTPAQLREFASLCAGNWTPPDRLVERFYSLAEGLLLDAACPLRLYVGYVSMGHRSPHPRRPSAAAWPACTTFRRGPSSGGAASARR